MRLSRAKPVHTSGLSVQGNARQGNGAAPALIGQNDMRSIWQKKTALALQRIDNTLLKAVNNLIRKHEQSNLYFKPKGEQNQRLTSA